MRTSDNETSESVDVCLVTLRGFDQSFKAMLRDAIPSMNQLIVDSTTKPLGKAREAIIEKVTTEKFVFVDDDVFLPRGWFDMMMKYWDKDSGWLEGWAVPTHPPWYHNWTMSRFKRAQPVALGVNQRAFTLDTIIKTEAVADWRSPEGLDFYEDWEMAKHTLGRGFSVKRVPVASEHRIPYDVWSQLDKGIKQLKRSGKSSYGARVEYGFNAAASAIIASIRERDVRIASNGIKYGLKYII